LLYFYICFESLLIPIYLLIGIWGARERKIQAAYYFFLYTLIGSLCRLCARLYIYQKAGTLNYVIILNLNFTVPEQKRLWLGFFRAFAIKRPLFPFHI